MEIKNVTDSVTEYLRNKIITGEMKAGQRMNETEVASNLNISRPPLREAFRILENEHLLVNVPRKVTYVSHVSIQDLEEVCQAREMVECYAIDLLKAKSIKELPDVDSALELASSLPVPPVDDGEQMFNYIKAFAEYHIELVKSAGNYWALHFYNSIASHIARYQCIYLYIPGSREDSLAEHQEILDLINRGSYSQAKKKIRIHIRNTFKRLKSKILQNSNRQEKSEV
jgi:DNA-binding GntR family transcriptional regulator